MDLVVCHSIEDKLWHRSSSFCSVLYSFQALLLVTSKDMHSEKGGDSSYTMTAAVLDHDAIHPSTDCPETVLSKNGTSDDNLADPEQTQSSAPIEVDGGYGWICVLCVFLVNAHTWGINSVRPHSWSSRQGYIC